MFSLKVIWNPLEGLDLGFFTLHFYSLSYVIAFVLGWYIIKPIFKRDGVSVEKLDPLFMYTVIGCLLGARLGHYLFYEPSTFFSDPLRVFLPFETSPFKWTGFAGMASHGAAIGIIIAMFFYSRKHLKKNMLWILDRIVVPTAIGGTFVRLGNLMNSEINGKPSGDFFAGFKFVRDTSDDNVRAALQQTKILDTDKAIDTLVNNPQYADVLEAIPYKHPAQLYEAICYVGVFIILYFVYWKTDKRNKLGYILGLFFVLLFTVRLHIETVKEPQTDTDAFELIGMHFNTGQLLSVPFILLGLFLMFRPDGMFEKKSDA
ncbi:prolipoprotein diacylglyceryl transferase [Nonlabens xylanidelens]|uniref:Phosphatidylglycerol--prolipoprotein diacylglyceryl transferase n=1 Tax=Nonlabens xylanidelens TaxID=191564 RepID=A0A2S6IHG8_9FLAO|nr:prolipoprotein diacylglyceryl transferase [Nonlabens xylanidelens]PPK93636.1 prolipoprotein diacylglyceryl transferase [Nonlabens xylanidelens]PQJ17781.1 prolipoprotein diacylglyceryl transferase [Nonlabens xylanidelens]